LNIGHTVQIDGAYGRFNFSDKNEQIWVSNGIGFTPFLARLKELAKQPSNQPIDWFHTDRNLSAEIIDQWKDLAQQANVTFHYIPSETQRLSADYIAQSVQNSGNRSLWLCGSRSTKGRDLCKIPFLPTAEIQTRVFSCFLLQSLLILPKSPLNPSWIPDNQASGRLLGGNRHT